MSVSEDHALPWAMLTWIAGAATWSHGNIWALTAAKGMSRSMALQQPASGLVSVTSVVTEDSVDGWGLVSPL